MTDEEPSPFCLVWPAMAVGQMTELASMMGKAFAQMAIHTEPDRLESEWATSSRVALEMKTARLRDFSTAEESDGAALVCAPFSLHDATVADLAPGHSLVAALRDAGLRRLFLTEWRSADPSMRLLSIDNYLADLNVMVDEIGTPVDLVGLCQGGWLALTYAARFPGKVRKLVLAAAPIDLAAGESALSRLAHTTPMAVFKQIVDASEGRIIGGQVRGLWGYRTENESIDAVLQVPCDMPPSRLRDLEIRFRAWNNRTVNLPGTYFLEIVQDLYKENRLASGRLQALGKCIDLGNVTCPLYLLAGRDDDIVAPEQVFAAERLVGTPDRDIRKTTAPCTHLSLFMGHATLAEVWPRVANWLAGVAEPSETGHAVVGTH